MRGIWILAAAMAVSCATPGFADTESYTGNFGSPETAAYTTATLTSTGTITLQTYGFGGGADAAGTTIAPGGFDPFVGLFYGTGMDAPFVAGTSDILGNYTPGCPPAGTVTVGTVAGQCGDVTLTVSGLPAGTYTVMLTDAGYLPAAVFETNGTLADGFIDLTGGVFQTCVDANNCNTDDGDYALDVTVDSGTALVTPEPQSIELVEIAGVMTVGFAYFSGALQKEKTRGEE